MPVQWSTRPTRNMGPGFVRVPPDKIVNILSEPTGYATLWIHWSEYERGSVPCMGDDDNCQHCKHSRAFQYTYAPCQVWVPRAARWVQAILPIGDLKSTLAWEDFTNLAVVIGKPASDRRDRTVYKGKPNDPNVPQPPSLPTFDVRPWLLRRWGLFKEADLIGCELVVPEPTLHFPQEETA